MKNGLIYITFIFIIISCNEYHNEYRKKYTEVILHYSLNKKDSLKLQSAYFLIDNMHKHGVIHNKQFDSLCTSIENEYAHTPQFFRQFLKSRITNKFPIIPDSSIITSNYLIRHIDFMHSILENSIWLNDMDFEIFKETLLPYSENYRIFDSLDYIAMQKQHQILCNLCKECGYSSNSLVKAYLSYDYTNIERWRAIIYNPIYINNQKFIADCKDFADFCIYAYRYAGIPIYQDITPVWTETNGGHTHIKLATNSYSTTRDWYDKSKPPRVYRKTFSHNSIPNSKKENIPYMFMSPFLTDVTHEYVPTIDANIYIQDRTELVYLCVFNMGTLRPITYNSQKKGYNYKFNNLTYNTLFFPQTFQNQTLHAVGSPFYISDNGVIHYMQIDTLNYIKVIADRKYPINEDKATWINTVKGVKMYFYNTGNEIIDSTILNPNFRLGYESINITVDKCKTIELSKDANYDLSELYFYSKNTHYEKYKINQRNDYNILQDSQPLTFINLKNKEVISFDSSIDISKIKFRVRNDDNNISKNHMYNVYYYHPYKGWINTNYTIDTEDKMTFYAPSNTIYWIKDKSEGTEERVFTYKDNMQLFW